MNWKPLPRKKVNHRKADMFYFTRIRRKKNIHEWSRLRDDPEFDKMNYKEIRNFLVALVVFLVIILIFRFIANLMGETSPTGPLKMFSWIAGSLVALEVWEMISR
jgi:hypothetical protein